MHAHTCRKYATSTVQGLTAYSATIKIMCACSSQGPPGSHKYDIKWTLHTGQRNAMQPPKLTSLCIMPFMPMSRLPSHTALGNNYQHFFYTYSDIDAHSWLPSKFESSTWLCANAEYCDNYCSVPQIRPPFL